MAVPANFPCPDRDTFDYCCSKLNNFIYKDDDSVKTDLNLILDQLNSLEYTSLIVSEQDGNRLLCKLCSIIPLHEDRLIAKLCKITNLWCRKQMLHLTDKCILMVVEYFMKAARRCQDWAKPDILRSLAAVLYENTDRVEKFHDMLLGKQGILVQLINNSITDTDTLREAVQCLECLTVRSPRSGNYLSPEHVDICYDIFCMLLHTIPSTNLEVISQSRLLVICLHGIQNILLVMKIMPLNRLGMVLAAVRAYMFFGLYTGPFIIPDCLFPSPLTKLDLPVLGKLSNDSAGKDAKEESHGQGQKKNKRRTKKKMDKTTDKHNKNDDNHANTSEALLFTMSTGIGTDVLSEYPAWSKVSSSDSDWSDTEGGQGSKLRSICTKVRQSALSCFFWIAKCIDKKVMFSYWSSFIPDSQTATNMINSQTLFTIVLKDPSPKCRMGSLAALAVLIDGTKLLLGAAEDSDESKMATFTPFSVILGSTIREIHRCLLLAMVSEDYPITLTQLIKCFGTVIANVPYHRMRPGLLSRVIKQVRHFINHRDPNVRVACLTCLGAMAKIQPPLMEVCHIVQHSRPPVTSRAPTYFDSDINIQGRAKDAEFNQTNEVQFARDSDSGFSSGLNTVSCEIRSPGGSLGANRSLGSATPQRGTANSSGMQTPVFSDQLMQLNAKEISWVVKLCVQNILPQSSMDTQFGIEDCHVEPLPVRLESLQVLANLTKGYFPIIRNCVPMIQELVQTCFCDTDPVIKLHAAKLLDEFTQVMLQDLQCESSQTTDRLDKQQVLDYWISLLNGPIQEILQDNANGPVRASTCDCVANIGNEIFVSLPRDKRIMCMTIVLGLSGNEDRFIRASAVRTLGIYVLYKSLRQDISFLTDAACAILEAMEDKNMGVRVKAAWSLANLADALALNREDGNQEFIDEFSDVVLLNVITVATKACSDGDKVKPNGVRGLGNVLRFITKKHMGKEVLIKSVTAGVKALMNSIGTGAMKVRWNACYALSNMYKNVDLNQGTFVWNSDVLNSLCSVVKNCKNFKVRINAAIAISASRERKQYGDTNLYCKVWKGIMDAFHTAEDIADYIDFRYRDNLIEQLCLAVIHLIALMQTEDLDQLMLLLHEEGEMLASSLDKYGTAQQKDSQISNYLEQASLKLQELKKNVMSDVHSTCLDMLSNLCSLLTTGTEEDIERPLQKSAFIQTYD